MSESLGIERRRRIRPVFEKGVVGQIAFNLLLSGLGVLSYFVLAKLVGPIALVWLAVLSVLAYFSGGPLSITLLLLLLFFQNSFIATLSDYGPDFAKPFTTMQATTFVVTTMLAALSYYSWVRNRQNLAEGCDKVLRAAGLFCLVVLLFAAFGAVSGGGIKSVIAYIRAYIGGLMMLGIGLIAGARTSRDYASALTKIFGISLSLWGLAELFFQGEMIRLLNLIDYYSMKYFDVRPVITNVDELLGKQREFLNLSGQFGLGFKIPVLNGPNIHPISFGYGLAFCGLSAFVFGSPFIAALCFLVTVVVGAKGPIVLSLFAYAFYFLHRFYGGNVRRWALTVGWILAAYIVVVFLYGLSSRDYHILGIMGSIKGFLARPWGHGVGVGGNFSVMATEGADFQTFQLQGYADYALETALGVLLYQIGVAIVVFFDFYRKLVARVWTAVAGDPSNPRLIVFALALILILVNAIFQEEAFSPAGWGLWLLMGGFLLGGRSIEGMRKG